MTGIQVDNSKRAFLQGRFARTEPPVRPPWIIENKLNSACTRCGDCLSACPEHIIRFGDGGYPEVDFRTGECSFCAACAEVCPEPLFDINAPQPWSHKADIADPCLTRHGVICQSCKESCEAGAIVFATAPGSVSPPEVQVESCTGCGACVSVCPADAISVVPPTPPTKQEGHG